MTRGSAFGKSGAVALALLLLVVYSALVFAPASHAATNAHVATSRVVLTGGAQSHTAGPSVTHQALTITNFTISPSTIQVNQTTYLNASATDTSSGGILPIFFLNFSSGLPSSCNSTATAGPTPGSANLTLACTANAAGTYNVTAAAIDFDGNVAYAYNTLVVSAAPIGPTISSFTATPSNFTLGLTTYLNVTVVGGTPPYTYAYGMGSIPGCSSKNTSSLACTPTAVGNYTVGLTVTDATGLTTTGSTSFTVTNSPGPTISTFTALPASFTVGNSTTLTVKATGGHLPYSYAYSGPAADGCTSSNLTTITCKPTSSGMFTENVTVTDTLKFIAKKGVTFTANPLPTISKFTATPPNVTIGGSTKLAVTVSGGTGPFSYLYSGLPTGCTSSSTTSLNCVPTATGTFSVSVTATDADGYKTFSAPVNVTVDPKMSVTSFVASPSDFQLENTTHLDVTISGGSSPFTYTYSGLPSGCASLSTASLSCTPLKPGVFNVSVIVTDSSGASALGATSFTVTKVPVIISFTASPSSVQPHSTTVLTVVASGGAQPYAYSYTKLPTGCSSSNVSDLSCTPVSTGTFNVTVTVTDAKKNSATDSVKLVVSSTAGSLAITSFTLTPTTVAVGASFNLTVVATGGKPPYSYNYTGLPQGCSSEDSDSFSCSPQAPGTDNITVKVTDSAGSSASDYAVLTVTGTAAPLTISLTSSASKVAPGVQFTLTATQSGGESPYTYVWSVNGANTTSGPDQLSWTQSISKTGTYTYRIWVTDEEGHIAGSGSVSVVVSSGSTSGGTGYGTYLPYIILAVLVVAVVAIIAILFMRKRSSGEQQFEPEGDTQAAAMFAGAGMGTMSGSTAGEVSPDSGAMYPGSSDSASSGQGAASMQSTSGELTACPQCGGGLGPDMTCYSCGVKWQASEAEAKPAEVPASKAGDSTPQAPKKETLPTTTESEQASTSSPPPAQNPSEESAGSGSESQQ